MVVPSDANLTTADDFDLPGEIASNPHREVNPRPKGWSSVFGTPGQIDVDANKVSASRYPGSMVFPRAETLQKEYDAYCLYRELISKPKALANLQVDEEDSQTQVDLVRVGVLSKLNISYSELRGTESDINRKKRYMRSLVRKTVLKVSKTIANVEHGKFPTDEEIEEIKPRFSSKQEALMTKPHEEWWSLDLRSSLANSKFDKSVA
jgi:hypothetical protein